MLSGITGWYCVTLCYKATDTRIRDITSRSLNEQLRSSLVWIENRDM
jgi:hypothetical protein